MSEHPHPLQDRTVVVAGAASAAGQAVVRRLTAAGAHVIAADRLPHSWDDKNVTGEVVDLLDADGVRAWARRIEAERGGVDGLVHLVGGWRGGVPFAETDLADWAFLHDLLIRTLQHTTLAFHGPLARSPRGRFAIVSQHAAQHPVQDAPAYATAKAAAEAWTLAMADSLGEAPDAAATILVVRALLTDAMRNERPDAAFTGLTHVDDLASAVAGLWDRSAAELNGTRVDLSVP